MGEQIANGSFESPALEPGGYVEGTEASVPGGMTFSPPLLNDIFVLSSAGILRPPNSVGTLAPAFGVQYGVLDSGGYLVIPFFIETPGSYVLDFWVAPQADGYLDYALQWPRIDGGPAYYTMFEQATVEVAWHHRQLQFESGDGAGLWHFSSNPGLDYKVYIDGISIIPEPSGILLLCLGLAVLAGRLTWQRNV